MFMSKAGNGSSSSTGRRKKEAAAIIPDFAPWRRLSSLHSKLFCARCAEDYKVKECTTLNEKFLNCESAHSITSRDCPVWKLEKVCAVKATEGISCFVARKKVKTVQDAPTTNVFFASMVNANPLMHSISFQTGPIPPISSGAVTTPLTPTYNSTPIPPTINQTQKTNLTTDISDYSNAVTNPCNKSESDKRARLNFTTLQNTLLCCQSWALEGKTGSRLCL